MITSALVSLCCCGAVCVQITCWLCVYFGWFLFWKPSMLRTSQDRIKCLTLIQTTRTKPEELTCCSSSVKKIQIINRYNTGRLYKTTHVSLYSHRCFLRVSQLLFRRCVTSECVDGWMWLKCFSTEHDMNKSIWIIQRIIKTWGRYRRSGTKPSLQAGC